ncbi:MAG: hypothetical protein ACKO7X_02930, partial [Bacteroidota bacterium]
MTLPTKCRRIPTGSIRLRLMAISRKMTVRRFKVISGGICGLCCLAVGFNEPALAQINNFGSPY